MTLLCLLILLALLTAVPNLALAEGGFNIAVATDMHYISPRLTDRGAAFSRVVTNADGKVTFYAEELLSAFVEQILSEPPDALILPGDLTFNGAVESHEDLAEKLRPVLHAGIPVFVIPGNHDIAYRNAARFSGDGYERIPSPGSAQFAEIWHDFGYNQALSRDAASLSYIAQLAPGWRLLLIDVNTEDAPGKLKDETIAWASDVLREAKAAGCRVLSVSHQTLLRHNPLFEEGFRMANAAPLVSLLEENSALHLSGHMHIQHIAESENGLTEITCSALAVQPCQFGLLTLAPDSLDFRTVKTDVSGWAKRHNQTDRNLLDFAGYALSFFASNTVRQSAAPLRKAENLDQILLWLINTNIGYFSGRLQNAKTNNEAIRLLMNRAPFWGVYMKSILPDIGHDYTTLSLPLR